MDKDFQVLDLDLLRPKPEIIKIAGKSVDVSFIPCGITFDVDKIISEIQQFSEEDLRNNGEKAEKAFNMTIRLCSLFCSVKYPDMSEDWFRANTSPTQIQLFAEKIQKSLVKSYEAVEGYSKNGEPAKDQTG